MSDRHFTLEELSAYLDGELDFDDRQRAHLKDCPECTRVFGGQRTLRKLARDAAPAVPTDAMWTAIRGRIEASARAELEAAIEHKKKKPVGRSAAQPKASDTSASPPAADRPGRKRFRWGPGAWLGLSSALAAAGVLLVIRPAVEQAGTPMPAEHREEVPARDRHVQGADTDRPKAPADRQPSAPPEPKQDRRIAAAPRTDPAPAQVDRSVPRKSKPSSRKPGKASSTAPDVGAPVSYRIVVANAGQATASSTARTGAPAGSGQPEGWIASNREAPERRVSDEAAAADNAGTMVASAPAREPGTAGLAATRHESASRSRAAAPTAAPAAAPVPATAAFAPARTDRPVFKAEAFHLTADRIITSDPGMISATGRVVVVPARPGAVYVATVDGLTRSLTGRVEGVMAEIVNPGQRLILHTKSSAHPPAAEPH